ncbi:RagB/SusD family nutrient uptake outer membrane protein [Parapedobacter sp.]
MKKLHYFVIAILFTTISCEDYLVQENPNRLESETFFADEASLEIYTNGLIRSFAPAINTFIDGDNYSDTHFWQGQYAYFTDSYSPSEASNWGTGNWSQLRSINYYLDNMREANAEPEILDHYEGVGRFFRAMFYFEKIQTFGAVPWYGTSIDVNDTESLFKDRDNREFIASKILEDLDYAVTHCLTSPKYRARASYIHRYVALALKARFTLYEGTMRRYHELDPSTDEPWTADESEMYLRECIAACEALMQSGVYSLYDNPSKRASQYREMFTHEDGAGAYTNAFIWARDYDLDLLVTYAINNQFVNSQHANRAYTRQFVNTYLMRDGTPFTSKYSDYNSVDFSTETIDRDYRLAQTIRTPGFTRDNGTTQWAPDVTFARTGYHAIKFLTDESEKDTHVSAIATDVPIMRYAEILLAYAEAKAELGEMTEDVWNLTIKPLRERAGVTSIYPVQADPYMVEYFQGKVTDPFILEVRRERGIELTMEGYRYDDIIRWRQGELFTRQRMGIWVPAIETPLDFDENGKPETIVTTNSSLISTLNILQIDEASEAGHKLSEGTKGNILPSTAIQHTWRDYKYVRPVPTTAIQENTGLSQNPGWE